MTTATADSHSLLLCVVQVGFAGSRRLFDASIGVEIQANLEQQLQSLLMERLKSLSLPTAPLMLGPQHFLCTISQLAVGADTLLTRACKSLDIPQRLFLPQHPQEFLAASNSDGIADFNDVQRAEAEALIESPHIIQVRVVSQSSDRHIRFEESNLEILRVSDVIVCLMRADADATAQRGGASDLLERAVRRGRPTLELRVKVRDGHVLLDETWHLPRAIAAPLSTETGEEPETIKARHPTVWNPPHLPGVIERSTRAPRSSSMVALPHVKDYCGSLKDFASKHARGRQRFFKAAAAIVIFTHVTATLFATLAMISHRPNSVEASAERQPAPAADAVLIASQRGPAAPAPAELQQGPSNATAEAAPAGTPSTADARHFPKWTVLFLGLELLLLAAGFSTHLYLHRSHAAKEWALGRLIAEIVRSMRSIDNRHVYLEHLFQLPLPMSLRPLLRTLSVLHLRSTRPNRDADWKPLRAQYIFSRLTTEEPSGQIGYYEKQIPRDNWWLILCRRAFVFCSVTAFGATIFKLCFLLARPATLEFLDDVLLSGLALLAIVLPSAAVGALSWAAARDAEARVQTFQETLEFLRERLALLQDSQSGHEFDRLMLETEARLLGETAGWFARRSFIAVS